MADGNHARIPTRSSRSAWSRSAAVVALGARIADPLIGLAITIVILKITSDSWQTIYGAHD